MVWSTDVLLIVFWTCFFITMSMGTEVQRFVCLAKKVPNFVPPNFQQHETISAYCSLFKINCETLIVKYVVRFNTVWVRKTKWCDLGFTWGRNSGLLAHHLIFSLLLLWVIGFCGITTDCSAFIFYKKGLPHCGINCGYIMRIMHCSMNSYLRKRILKRIVFSLKLTW